MTRCTSDGRARPQYDQPQQSLLGKLPARGQLSVAHATVLDSLTRAGTLSVGQLVATLGASAADGLRVIVDLDDAGYVRLRTHSVDGRIVVVDLVDVACPSLRDDSARAVVAVAC